MTKLKLYSNNCKTLVLYIGNSWSWLNWLESLSWFFLVFKGYQIQTLGMPQSKVTVNQLFLFFSVRDKKLWYPESQHEVWVSMVSTDRHIVEAKQRRKRHGKPKGKVKQKEAEMLRGGNLEEEHGTPIHRLVRIDYGSFIGFLFEYSITQTWILSPRERSVHRMRNFFSHSELILSRFYV